MNVITSTDGASLLHGLSSNLEGLLYDQRITRSMIDRAKPDLSTVKAYRGSDVAEYRASLAHRLRKLRRNRDAANRRVEEAKQMIALRNAQAAQTSTLAAHQVAYCITEPG